MNQSHLCHTHTNLWREDEYLGEPSKSDEISSYIVYLASFYAFGNN